MAKLFIKRRFIDLAAGLAIFLILVGLMLSPAETVEAAKSGLALCFNVIVPTLFPFFVLSTLIVELGLVRYLGRALEWLMRPLFNVGGACSAAFALGFIGGYPTGARTAISIYEKGLCSKAEAERLLSFCNNSGPAFILGVVGAGIFASSKIGVLLYAVHALASVAVGLIFRFYKARERGAGGGAGAAPIETVSLSAAFVASVKSSFMSTLNICAFVVFFTVAIRMLALFGILPMLAEGAALLLSPFGMTAEAAERLLIGFIEVSSGVWTLHGATGALSGRVAMAAFMLGWAGISVHCQVLSFIGSSGLSTRTYIAGKLLHGGISAALMFGLSNLLRLEEPVANYFADQIEAFASMDFTLAFGLSLAAASAVVLMIFLASATLFLKKHWKSGLS